MKPQKCRIVHFAAGHRETQFFVFFNMAKFCQILTLFAQVIMTEASGTNYDGYISAIGPKE